MSKNGKELKKYEKLMAVDLPDLINKIVLLYISEEIKPDRSIDINRLYDRVGDTVYGCLVGSYHSLLRTRGGKEK